MRVGAAATLHRGDLLRIREVADIEDAYAAEPVRAWRRKRTRRAHGLVARFGVNSGWQRSRGWRRLITFRQRYSVGPAVGASVNRFGRHEEQMAIRRDVSLAARAKYRSP